MTDRTERSRRKEKPVQPGDRALTAAALLPRRFAGRTGTVVEVREVAPNTTEVAVRLGTAVAWFRPEELCAVKVDYSPCTPLRAPQTLAGSVDTGDAA